VRSWPRTPVQTIPLSKQPMQNEKLGRTSAQRSAGAPCERHGGLAHTCLWLVNEQIHRNLPRLTHTHAREHVSSCLSSTHTHTHTYLRTPPAAPAVLLLHVATLGAASFLTATRRSYRYVCSRHRKRMCVRRVGNRGVFLSWKKGSFLIPFLRYLSTAFVDGRSVLSGCACDRRRRDKQPS
jgi:hypothetical protein